MRRRRTSRKKEAVPKVKTEVKAYTEPVLGVTYKDEHDVVKNVILPFGTDYIEQNPYKENFEDAFYTICTDLGGFWLDKCIIPVHRVLKLYMIEESVSPKSPPKPKPPKAPKAPKAPKKEYPKKTIPKKSSIGLNKQHDYNKDDGDIKC